MRSRRESNPRIAVLQTAVFPLHHETKNAVVGIIHHFLLNLWLMKHKLKISLMVVSGIGILITISFLVLRLIKPPKAALLVESSPNSTAFVNGEQVGRTPYEGEFSAGEVVIKLIPDSFESPLAPYQSTVDLVAGIKTVVRRSFGD